VPVQIWVITYQTKDSGVSVFHFFYKICRLVIDHNMLCCLHQITGLREIRIIYKLNGSSLTKSLNYTFGLRQNLGASIFILLNNFTDRIISSHPCVNMPTLDNVQIIRRESSMLPGFRTRCKSQTTEIQNIFV